ncbi:tail fiber domain-containing protein [Pseudooceanicola sp. MF1-13]|uniref:tail fiber domain-containing protein n=1 Tax=Pseudooceanicola sp. MF1-13 TaxID=3379095 RepID=UPI003892CB8E
MAWHNDGTVDLTNGSAAVSGTGTNFLTGELNPGDGFVHLGVVYEIASIESATALTLAKPFAGTTATGQTYAAFRTTQYRAALERDLSNYLAELRGGNPIIAETIAHKDDADSYFGFPANDNFAVTLGGVQRFGIDASKTFSSKRLVITETGNAGVTDISYGSYAGGAWVNTPSGTGGYLGVGGSGAFKWEANQLIFFASGAEKARLTSTGLGIGTSLPSTLLHLSSASPVITLTDSDGSGAASTGYMELKDSAGDLQWRVGGNSTGTRDLYLQGAVSAGIRVLTNSAERMRITADGKTGIGTGSPDALLHLVSTGVNQLRIAGTSGQTYGFFAQGNGSYAAIGSWNTYSRINFFADTGVMTFQAVGTERMRMAANGNVSIGTTATPYPLTVTNGGGRGIEFGPGYSGATNLIQHYDRSVSQYLSVNNIAAQHLFSINNSEKMRLDSNGNLIVGGTTAPSTASGRGNITINGSSEVFLGMTVGGSTKGYLYHTGSTLVLSNVANGPITLNTNNVERARIDASGSLLVGCTTTPGASVKGFAVRTNDLLKSVDVTTSVNQVVFYNPNGAVGTISTNGSATTYNTSSGRHLKENIVPFDRNSGAMIDALKPSTFDWINGQKNTLGFIADEFAQVFPLSAQKDDQGRWSSIDAGTPEVIATMVAELQSLRRRVAALETQAA